jgi:hypothetical protein
MVGMRRTRSWAINTQNLPKTSFFSFLSLSLLFLTLTLSLLSLPQEHKHMFITKPEATAPAATYHHRNPKNPKTPNLNKQYTKKSKKDCL